MKVWHKRKLNELRFLELWKIYIPYPHFVNDSVPASIGFELGGLFSQENNWGFSSHQCCTFGRYIMS
jgi:hypothetical protein